MISECLLATNTGDLEVWMSKLCLLFVSNCSLLSLDGFWDTGETATSSDW